jgi:transposase
MYHKGPGVKKSGPKSRNKAKGRVLDVMLEELQKDPVAPSEIISKRIANRTGVEISSRTVRRVRNERGKIESSKQSRRGASAPTSLHTYS